MTNQTDRPTSTTSSTPAGVGVFARVFPAGPAPQVAAAVHGAGFDTTQLNLSALNRPTLDDTLSNEDAAEIGRAFTGAGVRLWGLSGTFNAIHPDQARRRRDTEACTALIARVPAMDVPVVTLCTGTRDPENQWRAHSDNRLPDAWRELRATLDVLLADADAAGVQLGIEPESGNVVRNTDAAVRLLAELGNDARLLTIVLDPANLLSAATLPDQQRILDNAFDRLGDHIGALHAKDVVDEGSAAIGHGGLDLDLVLRRHAGLPRPVPVIAQDLTADDAPRVSQLLRGGPRPRPRRRGGRLAADRSDMSDATPPTHHALAGLLCRRVGTGPVHLLALHGLGGNRAQVLGMLEPRLHDVLDIVAPDLRAHGRCALPIDTVRLGFTPFADDVEALLEALHDDLAWRPDVLLGVSMGAGIGVELCTRGLQVDDLMLVRPAWAWQAHPPNLAVLGEVAALLASHGPLEGRRQLLASPGYQRIATVSQAAPEAVLGQFDDPDAVARRARLTRLPADAPSRPTAPVGAGPNKVAPRVHVVASPHDPLHPAGVAETLGRDLGGQLVEVAARYEQPEQHHADLASLLHQIAERLAGPAGPPP